MRYEGKIYRPPSEADAFILQATIGCSWNHCTYCDMYREKSFRVRDLNETLRDIEMAAEQAGPHIEKVFVADGDALIMPTNHWLTILESCREHFPNLRRVSCYAMARNVRDKSQNELNELRSAGLSRVYIGPESGDDAVLKSIAKGDNFAGHVDAAAKLKKASIEQSVIALLGIGGDRTEEHALGSAKLVTEMDPEFFAALTLTIVPGTPIHKLHKKGKFDVPSRSELLLELRTIIEHATPTDALFRTNHASNYLALGGRIPRDRDAIVHTIDQALDGRIPLRPEGYRGL